jgi:hypothetical protein
MTPYALVRAILGLAIVVLFGLSAWQSRSPIAVGIAVGTTLFLAVVEVLGRYGALQCATHIATVATASEQADAGKSTAAEQLDAADEARASSAGWRGPRS